MSSGHEQQRVWTAPPNWPAAPAGWSPPPGWQPDPLWGPPPADWEWWQLPAELAQPSLPSLLPKQALPPLDLSQPYVGYKAGDKRLETARAALLEGEALWAVVSVTGIKPMLDMLVITDVRAFAAWRSDMPTKGPRTTVVADHVASVAIEGMSRAVVVRDALGTEVRLGRLEKSQDLEETRRRLEELVGRSVTPERLAALRAKNLSGEAFASDDDTARGENALTPVVADLPSGWPEQAAPLWPQARKHLDDAVRWTAEGKPDSAPSALKRSLELVGQAPRGSRDQVEAVIRSEIEKRRAAGVLERVDDVPVGWPEKAQDLWPQVRTYLRRAEALTAEAKFSAAESELDSAIKLKSEAPLAVRGKVEDAVNALIQQRRDGGTLADPVQWRLDKAADCANRGDRKAEEAAIFAARRVADKAGLLGKAKALRTIDAAVDARTRKGDLRHGVTRLGVIPSSTLASGGMFQDDLDVLSDRIVRGSHVYLLDGRESLALVLDGQVVTSSRPTLTRMAVGSILPGTALIPGLAFQKKKTSDTRSAQLLLTNPGWQLTLDINPDKVATVRPIVAKLEAAIRQLERTAAEQAPEEVLPEPVPVAEAVPASATSDKLAQLERVAALLSGGAITADDAAQLRSEIMRGGGGL